MLPDWELPAGQYEDAKNHNHFIFFKASPARAGDCIELMADMDLIVALSACPQGDVSLPTGTEMPENQCYPLLVEIREVSGELQKIVNETYH